MRLYPHLEQFARKVTGLAYRGHLRVQGLLGQVEVGARCALNVPLVCNGQGVVQIDDDCSFGYGLAPMMGSGRVLLQARTRESSIQIGANSVFSNNVALLATSTIRLGRGCLVGDGVLIVDSDFHDVALETRHIGTGKSAPVIIEDEVWLGSRAVILRGAHIGKGSVIGAGAIVSGQVPPMSVFAGNPAKLVRKITEANTGNNQS